MIPAEQAEKEYEELAQLIADHFTAKGLDHEDATMLVAFTLGAMIGTDACPIHLHETLSVYLTAATRRAHIVSFQMHENQGTA